MIQMHNEKVAYQQGFEDGVREERPKAFANGYEKGYQQGKTDYANEIAVDFDEMDKTAYRMGRADGIAQGRADAIDECIKSLGMVLDNENIKSELKHLFEQLKEKKNE